MLIDLTGQRFGRLTVIRRYKKPGHMVYWNCICDCGNSHIAAGAYLKNGKIKSCGCLHKEESAVRAKHQFTKHADSGSRLYRIWKSMHTRCKNKNSKSYHDYGERGISICQEWNDYLKFKEWSISNGYRDDLTIDRINVNGNYCPENCRWVAWDVQQINKRTTAHITIKGVTRSIKEWSSLTGINYGTLKTRIYAGWNEDKLLQPVNHE